MDATPEAISLVRNTPGVTGFEHLLVHLEIQTRREHRRAQHPDRIFREAHEGIADRDDAAMAQMVEAARVVDHRARSRIVEERIDREVAPDRILRLAAVDVVGEQATVLVGGVLAGLRGTEGRDFDDLVAKAHMHDLEAPPDDARASEQRLHLFGRRVGGDVEILGFLADQQVAHRAADHIGLVAGLLQRVRDAGGVIGNRARIDAELVGAVDLGLARDLGRAGCFGLAAPEQSIDEFADHA